ncbi:MAG TPA: RodZ domain-containing protein [Gammaproteobacteria bacterium]
MSQETVTEHEPNTALPPSVAAGDKLRVAREALGLSRDDVARELRLHEKLIGALEAGERSQLPPATYISGYLRAYARLLALPADQLVNEYLNEQVAPSLIRPTDRSGMPMVSSRDPKFRLITYALVAVLVLLFSAWWVNQRFDFISFEPPRDDGAELEVKADLPEPMPLQDYTPVEEAAPGTAGEGTGSDPSAPGMQEVAPVQPLATAPQPVAPQPVTPQPVTPQPVAPQPVAPQPSASAPTTPAAPAVSTATPAAESVKPPPQQPAVTNEPLPVSTPQARLVLEYQAASWTQVEDAKGRVLVYEVVKPGRRLELRGVAPFKVFLGYAPGVLVYYNGTLFSHAPYQRGDLARFRVGANADNRLLDR